MNKLDILKCPPENKEEITHAITFLGRISTLIEGINNLIQNINNPTECEILLNVFGETLNLFQADITRMSRTTSQQAQLKNIVTTATEVISIVDTAFQSPRSTASATF